MTDERLRTDTAERPAIRVPLPPAVPPAPPPGTHEVPGPSRHRGTPAPPWVAWIVVGVALVLVAVIGAWLVVRSPGDDDTTATDPQSAQAPEDDAPAEPAEEEPAEETSPEPEAEPSDQDDAESSDDRPAGERIDITGAATPRVPRAAPANNDVTGELVTFVAANMMDANAATCWRMAGDGTGSTLTFTFASPVTLEVVGLVNGYAKTSVDDNGTAFDWYHGNRRILRAEWIVEGQVFAQDFADSTELQTIEIDPVETSTIELRLVEVSPPGPGPTARDFTAISDVVFGGTIG